MVSKIICMERPSNGAVFKKKRDAAVSAPFPKGEGFSALNSGSYFGERRNTSCDNHFHLYENLLHIHLTIFRLFCSLFISRVAGQGAVVDACGLAN